MEDQEAGQAKFGFWKPGTAGPALMGVGSNQFDRANEQESQFVVWNPDENLSIQQQRVRLPIYATKNPILYLVEHFQTVVVVGQTGSGKTTQIPQYLHEAGWTQGGRVVACTQPRRVAASTVALRVAQEMGVELGNEVGYAIRFDDVCDPEKTRIKYLTDGMLLRETMLDPLLTKYSVIMLDEAHERSIHTDILMGLLKKIQRQRKELRLIVSSATLDAEAFAAFFNTNKTADRSKDTSAILSIPGRQYPVEIFYRDSAVESYLTTALETIFDIHKTMPAGDILLFLTGSEEIDNMVELIHEQATSLRNYTPRSGFPKNILPLPLYSGLPGKEQMKVFEPTPRHARKVVVATNIAETSVTIPGIVYVIDSGFVKIRAFNPETNMDALVVTEISQAQANQRAGRSGRLRPGQCYRLYTEESYNALREGSVPELQRAELSPVIIQLKALGIDNILHFDFPTPPPVPSMIAGLELLYALGALDDDAKLTQPQGMTMAEFPVEPCVSKMLLASGDMGCSEETLSIAAMLSVQSVFVAPKTMRGTADAMRKSFGTYEGDHITLLNVYNMFEKHQRSPNWCKEKHINYRIMMRAVEVRNQLRGYLKRYKVPLKSCIEGNKDGPDPTVPIRKCLVSGFFANAAFLVSDGSYRTVKGNHPLAMHPSSVCFNSSPQWVIYHEIIITTKEYMRDVTVIEPQWLAEAAPHFYEWKGKPLPTQEEMEEKAQQDKEKEAQRALNRQIHFVMKYS